MPAPPQCPLTFIMLNPSTADGEQDDATIRRCLSIAWRERHAGIIVVNLFAWRSRDPSELSKARNADGHQADIVGPENDAHIMAAAASGRVVCAWGSTRPHLAEYETRCGEVIGLLRAQAVELWALGITKSMEPRHPLYLPKTVVPFRWKGCSHVEGAG